MNHFFAEPSNITSEQVFIIGSDVNHIRNVLRMRAGEQLLISDGAGNDYMCEIASIEENEVICDILETGGSVSEHSVRFYLFQGLPKADKFKNIIQKSVELGVYEIIPVRTARSIVKYDDRKAGAKQERWQKIAESAAKQSRRGIVPKVKEIMSLQEAFDYASKEEISLKLIPYENFKDIVTTKEILGKITPGMSVAVFIGPEGGFEEKEVLQANEAGAHSISLGKRILRTETAPLMLLSVLTFAMEE